MVTYEIGGGDALERWRGAAEDCCARKSTEVITINERMSRRNVRVSVKERNDSGEGNHRAQTNAYRCGKGRG